MQAKEKGNEILCTIRPGGRKGILISAQAYRELGYFILGTISSNRYLQFSELLARAPKTIPGIDDYNIPWYILQLKLDLEARGLLQKDHNPFRRQRPFIKLTKHGATTLRKRKLDEALQNPRFAMA